MVFLHDTETPPLMCVARTFRNCNVTLASRYRPPHGASRSFRLRHVYCIFVLLATLARSVVRPIAHLSLLLLPPPPLLARQHTGPPTRARSFWYPCSGCTNTKPSMYFHALLYMNHRDQLWFMSFLLGLYRLQCVCLVCFSTG